MGEHWFYSLADIVVGAGLAITGIYSLMDRDLNPFQHGAAAVYVAAGALFMGCNYRVVSQRRNIESVIEKGLNEESIIRRHAA